MVRYAEGWHVEVVTWVCVFSFMYIREFVYFDVYVILSSNSFSIVYFRERERTHR